MTVDLLEKYRPKLHFAPKQNWMNDPNGMVYFEGEYHLFYQYYPNGTTWGPMHWGHAVSKDMISWEELDIALYPDEHGTIFSGSAVVDWNNTSGFFPDAPGLVAIFTHHLDGTEEKPSVQTQSLAFSHDKGRTWTKYEGNPVLGHETKVDFRDPKVFWHKETEKWIMSLATGQTITFYSSTNLIDWKFESEFGEGMGSHDGVWECPDLFKLKVEGSNEEKWVLIVSIGDNPEFDQGSFTQYFTGSFDGSTFTADHDSIKLLDFGKDNYAGVSFSDIPEEDGRRIYLGWMSNWRYANQVPTEGWRSQMTLPRELTVRKVGQDYKVVQKLVKELNSYFSKKEDIHDVIVDGTKTFKMDESNVDLDLNIERVDAEQFGITLHHTEEQHTTITFDQEKNALVVDRKNSGAIDFSDMFSLDQEVKLENIDDIQLRLVVDSSSVELLVNEGEYSVTSLVYPDKACEGISVFTSNGAIKVTNGYVSSPSK
ncbi:glycoside hydrolase family 32 protein [Halalkalibacter lacteus]|uniref:glycoside hydrolase family 32 protein n=1 Tax=Halalkalibacter lacteus TaxID=3090663 RepID=UPI002FCAA7DA